MISATGGDLYDRCVTFYRDSIAVKNATVIGVHHVKWGEAIKALVVLHEGKTATEQELISFV